MNSSHILILFVCHVLANELNNVICVENLAEILDKYKGTEKTHKNNKQIFVDPPYIEYAHVGNKKGNPVFGASAKIKHATPRVTGQYEYSIAHVLLVSNYGTPEQKSIEAGWIRTYKSRFGIDNAPTKFFIRWTDDGDRTTGCANLDCDGFIHTNSDIEIGGPLMNHDPITIKILKDPNEKKWYLYKDGEEVGYWPNTLFTNLTNGFEQAIFGGEIRNTHKYGRHTHTQMGNGRYGTEGEGRAASINQIEVLYDVKNLRFVSLDDEQYEVHMKRPPCYNATVQNPHSTLGGFTLYYGGPGFDIEECNRDGAFSLR